jgi:hypothetical protein
LAVAAVVVAAAAAAVPAAAAAVAVVKSGEMIGVRKIDAKTQGSD